MLGKNPWFLSGLEPTGAGNAADNAEKLGLFNTEDKD